MAILGDKAWKAVLSRQIGQLGDVEGVVITAQGFVNENPVHRLYMGGTGTYVHKNGYQQIEFTLKCKAIMDCDPRRRGHGDSSPYALTPNDVVISDSHKLTFFFPRSFPIDPIGWGLFFSDEDKVPMYPNLLCTNESGGTLYMRFSGEHCLEGGMSGIICIGAAASSTGTPMYQLINHLRSYLLMANDEQFTHTSVGGTNDGGFDNRLMYHFSQNYGVLKKALDDYTGGTTPPTPPIPPRRPRRKLGEERSPRRILGG